MSKWFVAVVHRNNAGLLYAPVRYVGNEVQEHGITPSHNKPAMQKVVEELNNAMEDFDARR